MNNEIRNKIFTLIMHIYDWRVVPGSRKDLTGNDIESLFTVLGKVEHPDMTLGEIGCGKGSSSAVLASYIKYLGGKLFACDIHEGVGTEVIYKKNMKRLELDKYIDYKQISSQEASKLFLDETFDLIFIDANHRYKDTKEDINLWYPKVKKDGILCGHDCEIICSKDGSMNIKNLFNAGFIDIIGLHPGVILAVSERFEKKAHIEGDRIWWIKK